MDALLNGRLVEGGWLVDRGSGFFDGLVNGFEKLSPPPVDIVEDRGGYRFSIELPGLKNDSLEVKVEDDALVINAERNEPTWAKDAHVYRAERHYGRIHRAFRLPDDVARDSIKAVYRDGVLEVTMTKRPESKAVKVEIAYSS
jgi:HSP20 family protein